MLSVTVPQEALFYADSFYGHVGFIDGSSSETNSADLHLVAYSPRPVGVAYEPLQQVCVHVSNHSVVLTNVIRVDRGIIEIMFSGQTKLHQYKLAQSLA